MCVEWYSRTSHVTYGLPLFWRYEHPNKKDTIGGATNSLLDVMSSSHNWMAMGHAVRDPEVDARAAGWCL